VEKSESKRPEKFEKAFEAGKDCVKIAKGLLIGLPTFPIASRSHECYFTTQL